MLKKPYIFLFVVVSMATLYGFIKQRKTLKNINEHKFVNKLINETSPYLLQHAHNPVDWYPWGEDALKLARDK